MIHIKCHIIFTPSSVLTIKIPYILGNPNPIKLGNSLVHLSNEYSLKLDTLGLVLGTTSTFMPLGKVDLVFHLLLFMPIM